MTRQMSANTSTDLMQKAPWVTTALVLFDVIHYQNKFSVLVGHPVDAGLFAAVLTGLPFEFYEAPAVFGQHQGLVFCGVAIPKFFVNGDCRIRSRYRQLDGPFCPQMQTPCGFNAVKAA